MTKYCKILVVPMILVCTLAMVGFGAAGRFLPCTPDNMASSEQWNQMKEHDTTVQNLEKAERIAAVA